MAALSGIVPSQDLLGTWANALGPESPIRIIKIVIEQEALVSAAQIDAEGSDEHDFELLSPLGDDQSPCFLIYRCVTSWCPFRYPNAGSVMPGAFPSTPFALPPCAAHPAPSSANAGAPLASNVAFVILIHRHRDPESWLFISYVPDGSPVRSKMLYASSRQSLLRALGDSRFSSSIIASTQDELTFAAYQDHLAAQHSSAPLTAREQEIADIKAAEAKERREGDTSESLNQPRSMLDLSGSSQGTSADGKKTGTGWSDEAADLIKAFAAGDKGVLELAMFIYSCPSSSPIKSRMIYASSFHSVRTMASTLGVDVSRRLETSSPEEITDAFVAAEFGQAAAGGSAPAGYDGGDKPAFARPTRPGRKR
ncbi:BQ2448_1374 [Microbotryum intermedium]|uniref:BQ2448_1374 protein n=1 Tax=Microbotryum intermedium TaxID=269621 RepID=A0A238F807_9BASI|nr:BQ2448_1374 [Microbotryum intermedium]